MRRGGSSARGARGVCARRGADHDCGSMSLLTRVANLLVAGTLLIGCTADGGEAPEKPRKDSAADIDPPWDEDAFFDEDAEPIGSCANGILDSDESDVDCGGSCAKCADGRTCGGPADCVSGACTG